MPKAHQERKRNLPWAPWPSASSSELFFPVGVFSPRPAPEFPHRRSLHAPGKEQGLEAIFVQHSSVEITVDHIEEQGCYEAGAVIEIMGQSLLSQAPTPHVEVLFKTPLPVPRQNGSLSYP